MPGTDMSQFVSRMELIEHLKPLAEIRGMLVRQIDGLAEGQAVLQKGQADMSHQIHSMELEITSRMDVANHRTTTLEGRLDTQDVLLEDGKTHIAEIEKIVHSIDENGCHQIKNHAGVVEALESAGALLPPGHVARVEFEDERPIRDLVRRNPKKAIAVGSGALVGLGALVPHAIEFFHWVAHLFQQAPK